MIVKRGIPVSPGVIIGPALVLGHEDFRIPHRLIEAEAIDDEISRFHKALKATFQEIQENERLASQRIGKQYGAIFAAHLQMAQDPKLIDEIEREISVYRFTPEYGSSRVLRKYAKLFQDMGDDYFRERADDIFDLEKRILRHLLGQSREDLANLSSPVIVLAHNLTPSETAGLNREYVLGFATEAGGHTSHTAILAGALEIPAVVGVGNFLTEVSGGETIILDGNTGELYIDPPPEVMARYEGTTDKRDERKAYRKKMRSLESVTKDGVPIELLGNIEFPEECNHCVELGAQGVGLYRTEFLYLSRQTVPSEEDHYEAYKTVMSAFPDQPIIIRTLDVGADKIPWHFEDIYRNSGESALGLRSIRFSLQEQSLFKTQLRAILRAAVDKKVGVMFPLVTTLLEFRQARMIFREVMEDLEEQGIPFNPDIQIGIMIEVPSAVIMAEEFAREVDFFSIGTNDLIQYTLASDRSDPAVAKVYTPADPSILKMIRMTVEAANKHEISSSVCGQVASDPKFIPLLVGLGLRRLSISPQAIPKVKEIVRSMTIEQAETIANHVQTLELARDVENYLFREAKRLCPSLFS